MVDVVEVVVEVSREIKGVVVAVDVEGISVDVEVVGKSVDVKGISDKGISSSSEIVVVGEYVCGCMIGASGCFSR